MVAGLSPAAFPDRFLLMAALEALGVHEANNRMAPAQVLQFLNNAWDAASTTA